MNNSVRSILKKHQITGAAIAVCRHGSSITECYGQISAENKLLVNPNTVFELASLSKPVFATSFLNWCADTEFDLDIPLKEVYPLEYDLWNIDSKEPNFSKITARMLLNHTSGFNNWDNWCGAEGQGVRNNGAGKFWVEPFSAYSFYSSVADMAQFISNAISTAHSMSHSLNRGTPGIPLTEFCSWRPGWGIEHGANFETLWHWENLGDYQCFMAISSELQDGIVILTNSGNAKPAFAELVEHYLGRSMACAQVGFIERIVGHKFCP